MSYALRNSIVIGVLLVLALGVGIYWIEMRWVEQIDVLEAREKELRGDLKNINAMLSIYDSTLATLNRLKDRWQARRQIVPAKDNPARTLAYLYELLNPLSVNFDFLHKGDNDEASYSVNTYALQGEGRFKDIYAFIWQLEHGRRFHTVDLLQLEYSESGGGKRSDKWDWTTFKMIFRAYFEPGSRVEDLPATEELVPPVLGTRNPFRPLITKTLPENHLGLFEVEGAQLKGLSHNMVYLMDRSGQIHHLHKGDRVFMGKLDKVDIFRNQVEFVLNKGGIWERVTLNVETRAAQP